MDSNIEIKSNQLTLDDLHVGQIFESASHHIDAEQIMSFAREFDPQPFHLDDEAAKDTLFGNLAASGWHTAAITMNLLVASTPIAGGLIGTSADIFWPRPTRAGDTLHVNTEVLDIKPSRSRSDRGMVTVRSITLNQDNRAVQILTSRLVVPRRASSVARAPEPS